MVRFRSVAAVRALPQVLVATAIAAAIAIAPVALWSASAGADPNPDTTTFTVGTPQLSSITNNGTSLAPWNNWQGDSSAAEPSTSELFPTYTPSASDPTITAGGVTYPNLSTYGVSGADGTSPYPDGTVGTPGPLDDYCGSGDNPTESAGTPTRQPAGEALPMSPYYFPHIVSNPDGSLTGYFDWRPKDADEAIVVARSTDGGVQWTYEGEALEQNPNYCPNADINDDGEGHPNVLTIGGNSYLYTLQRAAGDNLGVGLLVHSVDPSAPNPLASVPSTEQVGLDADSFATATDAVSSTASVINVVQTLSGDLVNGNPTSPEELVPGPFVDLTQTPTPSAADVITCTAVTATSLTGCTTTGATINVANNDLIEQVIATVKTSGATIPTGPNTSTGDGGLASLTLTPVDSLSMTILNNNAPNRVYVDGEPVYCDQSNANPTTKIEDCTTGVGAPALSPAVGAPVTMDPVVPATAEQTNGLVSPDGIVGVLPTYPGVPAGATAVMYTEKELNYFMAGDTSSSAAASASTAFTISFLPSSTEPQDLPATINAANPVTIQAGVTPTTGSGAIEAMTCTGLTTATGTPGAAAVDKFTGCLLTAGETAGTIASSSYLATADGANTPESTLAQTGEGSTKSSATAKLFKNNEDLEILRVAYTTDGINFSSAGLDNNGIISGSFSGENSGVTAGQFNPASSTNTDVTGTSYTDISNPEQTASPSNLNAYAGGNQDATEMRWVGSTGTIVTNPNGTIGLFLNGAFAADGDSDAFNQIFYTESTNGESWTTPVALVSTDYTFAASAAQEASPNSPLGISAYYSGRAYNPTVVQNPDGTLTMLFSGYRTPGTASVGSAVGTNSADPYTPSATDPNLYRTILVTTLTESSSPLVSTTTSVTSDPPNPVDGQPVSYTATVTTTGATTPTGAVSFSDSTGTLCANVALSESAQDTATCSTTYNGSSATATYSGDTNYATSTSSLGFAPDPPTAFTATSGNGQVVFTWEAPTNTGGSAVTGYTVSDTTGDSCTAPSTGTGCTISNLTNGTSYTFSVTATNGTGTSAPSAPQTVTPFTLPGSPTITGVTAGNSAITIDWTAGASGGSSITGYAVNAFDSANPSDDATDVCGPASDASSATTCSTGTLVDGESYTFEVAALNAAGTGPFSAPSSAVTFVANPESPAIASVTPSDSSLTVKWTAPTSDGGSPITGYTVSQTDDNDVTTTDVCPSSDSSTSLQCVVANLTNGDDYTFEVAAINAVGTGPFSSPSTPVAPYTKPGAPIITTETAGDGSIDLAWTVPSDDGGNAVSGYSVSALDTNTSVTTTNACPGSETSSVTSCTVSNLTNGVPYTFEVAAINAAGTGAFSGASSAITPYGSTSAPGNVNAKAGVLSAHLTWTAPSNNGGSPITGYTVSALNVTTNVATLDVCGPTSDSSTSLSCTATNLTAGDSYTFTVAAINAGGPGTFSGPSGRVVPQKSTLSVDVTGSQAYHSSSPSFTTTTSAPAGDSFTGTLVCRTVNPGKQISSDLAVGTYTIAGQSCSGLSLSGPTANDYSIAYSGGSFVVTSVSLTVSVTGTQSYRSSSPTFATTTSAPAGERFIGVLRCTGLTSPSATISASLAVGNYTIDGASCSGLSLTGPNGAGYAISYVGGAFRVTPAILSVEVTGSQTYHSSSPSFTTSSSAPSGDHFTGTLVCTKVAPSKSISASLATGAYVIVGSSCSGLGLSGASSSDYTIEYEGGPFLVRP